jgi:hypothetical protein
MRSRAPLPGALAGALLLLVAVGPLAAAEPSSAEDSRRAWLFDQGSFRRTRAGRWIEDAPDGTFTYREHNRTPDYIELFDPDNKRYVRLYARGYYVYVPKKKHYTLFSIGRWTDPRQRPLDHSRNSSERRKLTTYQQRAGFPRLGEEFEVMGPASASYNCIGWSVGNTRAWVWPTPSDQSPTLYDFDSLYGSYGFRRVNALDFKRAPSTDKVVLYAMRKSDGSIALTHAALQLRDGSWASKLGSLPLIRHLHPNDVAGPSYGVPYVTYVRARGK